MGPGFGSRTRVSAPRERARGEPIFLERASANGGKIGGTRDPGGDPGPMIGWDRLSDPSPLVAGEGGRAARCGATAFQVP